jgi:uncharacterized protein (TIGR03000 family)
VAQPCLSRIHVGPPDAYTRSIPGSFNRYFPPDYGLTPDDWTHWPTFREALDQYGWFGIRAWKNPPGQVSASPDPPLFHSSPIRMESVDPPGPPTALIRVLVPEDASVWFDDQPTAQRGTSRLFETPPLSAERSASYQLRARWRVDGREVETTKTIRVYPGDRLTIEMTATETAEK